MSKQSSAQDIQKKIDALQRSLNRREERDWQPAHLLLSRCGIKDPHEAKKIKPPMYFRESDHQRGYTAFEKKDVLNPAIEEAPPVIEDGNSFFKDIQAQYDTTQQTGYVDLEEEAERLSKPEEPADAVIMEPQAPRPPMSLFESIFNGEANDDDV